MKAARLLAPIAIGIYVLNALILQPALSDYVIFTNNFQDFFGISALQNIDLITDDFGNWLSWMLGGIINIGLVVVMVLALASKDKPASTSTNQWGTAVVGAPERQAPPPPPVD
jgi:hypothetical protein